MHVEVTFDIGEWTATKGTGEGAGGHGDGEEGRVIELMYVRV